MAWTELVYGLGYMIGPAIGSALYILGGFQLPFWVVGGIGVVISVALFFVVPKVLPGDSNNSNDNKLTLTIWDIFKVEPFK